MEFRINEYIIDRSITTFAASGFSVLLDSLELLGQKRPSPKTKKNMAVQDGEQLHIPFFSFGLSVFPHRSVPGGHTFLLIWSPLPALSWREFADGANGTFSLH